VDVPGASGKGLRLLLDLLEYPNRLPNCFLPGKYALALSVYSENATRRDINLHVAWSGKWQKAEPEMFREIVISTVKSIV